MKKYLLFFATILCCVFLGGCSSDENSKKKDDGNESNNSGTEISVAHYSKAIKKDWLASKFVYLDRNNKVILEEDLSFYRVCDLDLYSFKEDKVFMENHSFDCSELYKSVADYKIEGENLLLFAKEMNDNLEPLEIISLTTKQLVLKVDDKYDFFYGKQINLPEGATAKQVILVAK
ncbi:MULTISPECIES: hypothetical protein [Myroides]|uniref:Lipocalin-like domain-containing protein n=1 Tax=Myroides albus TaxID=2562892 RepID=A0A6I3LN92_9FLAO|nr:MULTISPECIES: hypothetical protein [Myroides]MTG98061.1 hypothetical protein [Myroides albus]MVX36301.1 hypothetical protein [Myroides sp. LoEW2-1]UVD80759.1 hypothetical protein NWE55_05805 [Myroides albus]